MNNVIVRHNGSSLEFVANDYLELIGNLVMIHDNAVVEVCGILTRTAKQFLNNPDTYQKAVDILLNIPNIIVYTENFNKDFEADRLVYALEEIQEEIYKISVHDSVADFADYHWHDISAAKRMLTAYMPREPYEIYREFYLYYVTSSGQVVMFWRA